MFGGEEGRLAALGCLVGLRPGGHQLHRSHLYVGQLPQALLSVPDHQLHRAQLLRHHEDLRLERQSGEESVGGCKLFVSGASAWPALPAAVG